MRLMSPDEMLVMASRMGVSVTLPERDDDIDAQIRALADPEHPKRAVFLARGNRLGHRRLPKWLFVEKRDEGTLITTIANIALAYRMADHITDAMLADILRYPEAKADVLAAGHGYIVQARDAADHVIYEAACSCHGLSETIDEAHRQKPAGGVVDVVSAQEALSRRIGGLN